MGLLGRAVALKSTGKIPGPNLDHGTLLFQIPSFSVSPEKVTSDQVFQVQKSRWMKTLSAIFIKVLAKSGHGLSLEDVATSRRAHLPLPDTQNPAHPCILLPTCQGCPQRFFCMKTDSDKGNACEGPATVWQGSVPQRPPQGMVFSVIRGRSVAWGWGGWAWGAERCWRYIPLSLTCCFLASSASGWVLKSPALGLGAWACMGKGSAQQNGCGQPSRIVYLRKAP